MKIRCAMYDNLLLGAITVLSGAVGFLFRLQNKRYEECESDRRELWAHLAKLEEKVPNCPAVGCKEDTVDV